MTDARRTVTLTRHFDAPPTHTFDAWLDPAQAGRWLFATKTGEMVRVEIDPRVGGAFCFTDRRDGLDVEHKGTYLEIGRPRRLAFSFAATGFFHLVTHVTVAIVPDDAGCLLTLIHADVLADFAERTQAGWASLLDGLAATLA